MITTEISNLVGRLKYLIEKQDGKRKPMKVQSLVFSKDKFKTAEAAKKWASDHDFKSSGVDETGNSFRIRQKGPAGFKKFRTISLTDGVKAVVGKSQPTSSSVHVPTAGEEIPADHKQPVRLCKIAPPKTAGQLYDEIFDQHPNIGGTIKMGAQDGSDITPLDGEDDGQKSTERFVFGPMTFDIDKAREMGGNEPNSTAQVSPDWSHKINIDSKAALKGTSTNPVMIAQIPTTNGIEPLLIDGHHRMHKATHDGKKELPAHIFTPDETMELMHTTPDLMEKMRANLKRSKPMVSTENPGDGKPIDKDLDEDLMEQARQDVLLSDPAIELKTAKTWAARAIAAFEKGDVSRAEDSAHEALEHAALVKDGGATVGAIEQQLRAAGLYQDVDKGANPDFSADVDLGQQLEDMVSRHVASTMGQKDDNADAELAEEAETAVLRHVFENLGAESEERYTSKDTEEGTQGDIQVNGFSEAGGRSSGGMGDNTLAGLYDMQEIISGMDWELSHDTADTEIAREAALDNLEKDPEHYKKLRTQEDAVDWGSGWGIEQSACKGLNVDIGSGPERESGFIGLDLQKHDHGTAVHDVHMGLPFPDKSVKNVLLRNSLHTMDEYSKDPKPLLAEIVRTMMPGGQFVYEGPNQLNNMPPELVQTWSEKLKDQMDRSARDSGRTEKIEGSPRFRQEFARVAAPDAATANDSEPRIGVAQYDMLPADALLAIDALGYYWSDATSSGRGNRLHGYPSQGALVQGNTRKEFKGAAPIYKADEEKRVLYCVVLAPDEVDLQEDWMRPEEIEKTAHFYMLNGQTIGREHSEKSGNAVVESFIAPVDIPYDGQYGSQTVKKGSWVIGVKVFDDDDWAKVKSGEYSGVSVGGWGERTPSSGPNIKQW